MNNKLSEKNNVEKFRVEKELSQRELANLIGVSTETVVSIENGSFRETGAKKFGEAGTLAPASGEQLRLGVAELQDIGHGRTSLTVRHGAPGLRGAR